MIPDWANNLQKLEKLEAEFRRVSAQSERFRQALVQAQEEGRSKVVALEAERGGLEAENARLLRLCDSMEDAMDADAALSPASPAGQELREDHEQQRGNLLALTHRDGGQYIQRHGWREAQAEAEKIIIGLMERREAMEKALRAVAPAVCSYLCPCLKPMEELEWTHSQECQQVSKALAAFDKEARDA
jgi:hypothetical protein